MIMVIDGNLISRILLGVFCLVVFGAFMKEVGFPFLEFVGKVLSSVYNFIAKPIRKLCAAFDKWNKNPPKKDFESF